MPYSGSAGPAAAPVLAAHHDGVRARRRSILTREVDDVEQVHGELRAGQRPAHRAGVDGAHVDRDDPDGGPPGGGGLRQLSTRRHRRCGPRPGPAAPARRTGRRSRCATGLRAAGIPRSAHRSAAGPAAAVLIDAQVRRRRGGLLEHQVHRGGERRMRDRPRHSRVPGRLGRRDAPLRDLRPGLLRSRRVSRHRGGTCGTHSVERLARTARLIALPAALDPPCPHPVARPGARPADGPAPVACHPPRRPPALPSTRPRPDDAVDRPYLPAVPSSAGTAATRRPACADPRRTSTDAAYPGTTDARGCPDDLEWSAWYDRGTIRRARRAV